MLTSAKRLGVAWLAWSWVAGLQAELVYNNVGTTNSQPAYFPATIEYGDEVRLDGIGREIIQFRTEYFGDLPVTNGATARVRFYANDGPGRYPEPRTLLFESDPFPLSAGYSAIAVSELSVNVPDVFTWTIEFRGLSGAVGQLAGLLLYDPPQAGFSYDDFWQRTGTNWTLFRLNGVKANFAARIIARDQLAVQLGLPRIETNGDVRLQLTGLVGRTCVVQASTNLTDWTSIGAFDFVRNHEEFVDSQASARGRRFYRTVTSIGGPPRLAPPTVTTNGLIEIQVAGPERLAFALQGSTDLANWTDLATNAFTSRPFIFIDPESGARPRRFYRARLIP